MSKGARPFNAFVDWCVRFLVPPLSPVVGKLCDLCSWLGYSNYIGARFLLWTHLFLELAGDLSEHREGDQALWTFLLLATIGVGVTTAIWWFSLRVEPRIVDMMESDVLHPYVLIWLDLMVFCARFMSVIIVITAPLTVLSGVGGVLELSDIVKYFGDFIFLLAVLTFLEFKPPGRKLSERIKERVAQAFAQPALGS